MKIKYPRKLTKIDCECCYNTINFKAARKVNGKYVCYDCSRNLRTTIGYGRDPIPIKDVLSKTYTIRKGVSNTSVHFPRCMVGRKFKVVLVEE